MRYDLAVIGAGMVGLAHARAAALRGLKVIVVERDHRAVGASVRNFGFVTVTGQEAGQPWDDALASREIWQQVANQAGIDILQRGLFVLATVPEAVCVLEEFKAQPMGEGCRMMAGGELRQFEAFANGATLSALYSPHEIRVEARSAMAKLSRWLSRHHDVDFLFDTLALGVDHGGIATSRGKIAASRVVVCTNGERQLLFADAFAAVQMRPCQLQMMRLSAPSWRLPGAVMSDFGLTRYLGYERCASLPALRARLTEEHPDTVEHGIHVIAVQSADGSVVLGDSHHYQDPPGPFASRLVEDLILSEAKRVLNLGATMVDERWLGVYPSGPQHSVVLAPDPVVRVVVVTSGTGMSTSFGLAERVIHQLIG